MAKAKDMQRKTTVIVTDFLYPTLKKLKTIYRLKNTISAGLVALRKLSPTAVGCLVYESVENESIMELFTDVDTDEYFLVNEKSHPEFVRFIKERAIRQRKPVKDVLEAFLREAGEKATTSVGQCQENSEEGV
ncbi:MAG: hypothetical protein DRP56_00990 [Planctomycetota bacterium]|nr:MAG: hypothetical protein DRP56_00990 [Planctomycetota bacterium]